MKRILMPWTALVVGALPLLAALLVLPHELTGSRSFTVLLIATYFLAGTRLYKTRRPASSSSRFAFALPAVLVSFALADVMAFVHLEMPFWTDGEKSRSLAARTLEPERLDHTVYIVEHGWHTGLVLSTADLAATDLPYFATLKQHRFLEVGWGDATFFQADDPTLAMALDAMLTPDPAVLHVAAFDQPVNDFFRNDPIHEVPVSASGVARLGHFVAASFADHENAEPQATSAGNYGTGSRYVAATGSYYFPNTCNVWTANALLAGGLDVSPGLAVTSRALLHQVRQIAKSPR